MHKTLSQHVVIDMRSDAQVEVSMLVRPIITTKYVPQGQSENTGRILIRSAHFVSTPSSILFSLPLAPNWQFEPFQHC